MPITYFLAFPVFSLYFSFLYPNAGSKCGSGSRRENECGSGSTFLVHTYTDIHSGIETIGSWPRRVGILSTHTCRHSSEQAWNNIQSFKSCLSSSSKSVSFKLLEKCSKRFFKIFTSSNFTLNCKLKKHTFVTQKKFRYCENVLYHSNIYRDLLSPSRLFFSGIRSLHFM